MSQGLVIGKNMKLMTLEKVPEVLDGEIDGQKLSVKDSKRVSALFSFL